MKRPISNKALKESQLNDTLRRLLADGRASRSCVKENTREASYMSNRVWYFLRHPKLKWDEHGVPDNYLEEYLDKGYEIVCIFLKGREYHKDTEFIGRKDR